MGCFWAVSSWVSGETVVLETVDVFDGSFVVVLVVSLEISDMDFDLGFVIVGGLCWFETGLFGVSTNRRQGQEIK